MPLLPTACVDAAAATLAVVLRIHSPIVNPFRTILLRALFPFQLLLAQRAVQPCMFVHTKFLSLLCVNPPVAVHRFDQHKTAFLDRFITRNRAS